MVSLWLIKLKKQELSLLIQSFMCYSDVHYDISIHIWSSFMGMMQLMCIHELGCLLFSIGGELSLICLISGRNGGVMSLAFIRLSGHLARDYWKPRIEGDFRVAL